MSQPADAAELVKPKPKAGTGPALPTDDLTNSLAADPLPADQILGSSSTQAGSAGVGIAAAAAGSPAEGAAAGPKRPPLERQKRFTDEPTEVREARRRSLDLPGPESDAMMLPNRMMGKGATRTRVLGEGDKGSAVAGTPRTLAAVSVMDDAAIGKYPGDVGSGWPPGPQARPILMEAFGQNWFFAKDVLIGKNWPAAIREQAPSLVTTPALATKLMWKLLALRTYEYDGILHLLRERYRGSEPSETKDDDILKWGSAGSVTLTSDVDVNLGGKYNMQAVGDFNAEFKKRGWGVEAGTAFDVNVYCKDNMHGFGFEKMAAQPAELKKGKKEGLAVMKVATEKNMPGSATGPAKLPDVANEEEDQANQEIAAMVKLIRFMTHGHDWRGDADWEKYKKGLRASQNTPALELDVETYTKVSMAEVRYDQWRTDLTEMKAKLVREGAAAVNHLQGVLADREGKAAEALDMQASNRLYEKKILQLMMLRTKLEQLAADKAKDNTELIRVTAIDLRQKILEAGMFANEAMITAGASNFVVFGTQVGAKADTVAEAGTKVEEKVTDINIKLTEKQFYDAFTEQLADTIKEFHHFKSLDEGLYKGGKYLMRMTLAADQLDGVKQANVPNYENLRQLGDYAMTAKNMDGTPDAINAVMWKVIAERFPALKKTDVEKFTGIVTDFGIGVAAAYKAAKAGVKVPPKPKATDADFAAKQKVYEEQLALSRGTKLKLAAVHGEDLSAAITELSKGAVKVKPPQ